MSTGTELGNNRCRCSALSSKARAHNKYCPNQYLHCLTCATMSATENKNLPQNTKKSIQCEFCPKSFPYPSHYKLHQAVHTGRRQFSCEQCHPSSNSTFTRLSSLKEHQKEVHISSASKKRHQCDQCTKGYTRARALANHQLLHQFSNLFQCPLCASTFAQGCNLKHHLVKVHNQSELAQAVVSSKKPQVKLNPKLISVLKCPACTESFVNSQQLKEHLIAGHQEMKPMECTLCNLADNPPKSELFNKIHLLSEHIERVHPLQASNAYTLMVASIAGSISATDETTRLLLECKNLKLN